MWNTFTKGTSMDTNDEHTTRHLMSQTLDSTLGSSEYLTTNEASFGNNTKYSNVCGTSSDFEPSSSEYFSTRIQRMMQQRMEFDTDLEAEIEASKDHWTELKSMNVVDEVAETNMEVEIEASKDHGTELKSVNVLDEVAETDLEAEMEASKDHGTKIKSMNVVDEVIKTDLDVEFKPSKDQQTELKSMNVVEDVVEVDLESEIKASINQQTKLKSINVVDEVAEADLEVEVKASKDHRTELKTVNVVDEVVETNLEVEIKASKDHQTELKSMNVVDEVAEADLEVEVKASKDHRTELKTVNVVDEVVETNLEVEIKASKDHQTELKSMNVVDEVAETDLEVEINASKVHRIELKSMNVVDEVAKTNLEVYQRLQKKNRFFCDWGGEWVMSRKIAEGAQAEIYEAELIWKDGRKDNDEWVLKVMKHGSTLQDLQAQWPQGMFIQKTRNSGVYQGNVSKGGTFCAIYGGILLKNGRFAFVMRKYWGDLRKLIDLKMQNNQNSNPPFTNDAAFRIMYDIAKGMFQLHTENIIHRDLKASNVLISHISCVDGSNFKPSYEAHAFQCDVPISHISYIDGSNFDPVYKAHAFKCDVADFECSVGILGTRFWRAPEILRSPKNRVVEPTQKSDVYSFAMTCYEILTGHIPFEECYASDYEVVLRGERPHLPRGTKLWMKTMLSRCWHLDPSKRPTFKEIVDIFEKKKRWHAF